MLPWRAYGPNLCEFIPLVRCFGYRRFPSHCFSWFFRRRFFWFRRHSRFCHQCCFGVFLFCHLSFEHFSHLCLIEREREREIIVNYTCKPKAWIYNYFSPHFMLFSFPRTGKDFKFLISYFDSWQVTLSVNSLNSGFPQMFTLRGICNSSKLIGASARTRALINHALSRATYRVIILKATPR